MSRGCRRDVAPCRERVAPCRGRVAGVSRHVASVSRHVAGVSRHVVSVSRACRAVSRRVTGCRSHVGDRSTCVNTSTCLKGPARLGGSCRARECAVQVLVRRQTAHPFIHSDHKRAVNRLPPRGSPSRHGALLAHELTVELSHSSSHGAKRQSCHAGKSISVARRNALWHSLASGS